MLTKLFKNTDQESVIDYIKRKADDGYIIKIMSSKSSYYAFMVGVKYTINGVDVYYTDYTDDITIKFLEKCIKKTDQKIRGINDVK